MAEMSTASSPSDRRVEQAIVALKKGAHLLKCGRRGKPKFCPFRLSSDETALIWYSAQEERRLNLNSVVKVVPGQQTVNFLRQPQSGKEAQSLSLIYQSGGRSLDLICKDKEQAETWFLALKVMVSESHNPPSKAAIKHTKGTQSVAISPVGHGWRKHNGEFLESSEKFAQVQSLCGSPACSLLQIYTSDDSSYSPSLRERNMSDIRQILDKVPHLPQLVYKSLKEGSRETDPCRPQRPNRSAKVNASVHGSRPVDEEDALKDVFMWGEGVEDGVLGGGGGADRYDSHRAGGDALLPRLLKSTDTLEVRNIFCGKQYASLVTKQGEIFTWGEEHGGRLGHKTNLDVPYPKLVDSLVSAHVVSVACGASHACALTSSGEVYEWGDSCHSAAHPGEGNRRSQWIPRRLAGPLSGISISKVACGDWHTAVVSSSGQLFTYGNGVFGVLGHGDLASASRPKEVDALRGMRVKSVACGPWHTAAVVEVGAGRCRGGDSSGKLFTWGDNDEGKLGHPSKDKKLVPTCVAALADHDFVQVSCGVMLTVVLTITGTVFAMGSSIHGQLGNPRAEDKSVTNVEGALKGEYVKEISAGSFHVAALTAKGQVYTWGKGRNGRLGLGDAEDRNSPACVEALKDRQVQCVACGSSFTAAICLHRSILSCDQSVCNGCHLVFGFTRKKHNCYNCGLLFCHSCTGRKALNASLAPDKNKQSRVCDSCFKQLKVSESSSLIERETSSPRLALLVQKRLSVLKADLRKAGVHQPKIFSPKLHCREAISNVEDSATVNQVSSQKNSLPFPLFPSRRRRWGQVSCPVLFNEFQTSHATGRGEEYEGSDICLQENRLNSKSMSFSSSSLKADFRNPDKLLVEELQQLRDEVRNLTRECQDKVEKLEQCKQRVKETLSMARDEAARCIAAKDAIKALTEQMNAIAEKFPAAGEVKSLGSILYDRFVQTPEHACIQTKLSEAAKLVADANGAEEALKDIQRSDSHDCLSPSADPSTETKKRTDRRWQTGSPNEPHLAESNASNPSKTEWIEQDEPGVYITFMILPSGRKGLKRVRFSRRQFSEKEAEKWWKENQIRVYLKYDIEQMASTASGKT